MDILPVYGCQRLLKTLEQMTANTFVYILDEVRGKLLPYPPSVPTSDLCPSPSQSDLDLSKTNSMVDGLSRELSRPEQTTQVAMHEQYVSIEDETSHTPCHRLRKRKRTVMRHAEEHKQPRPVRIIPKRRMRPVEESLRDRLLRSKAKRIYRMRLLY